MTSSSPDAPRQHSTVYEQPREHRSPLPGEVGDLEIRDRFRHGDPTVHHPAVVIGGGLAGLRAADVLAGLGHTPLLLEARDACGGLVRGGTVGGVEVTLGAEGFAGRSREVADLCIDLGLPIVAPAGEPWIWTQEREHVTPERGDAPPEREDVTPEREDVTPERDSVTRERDSVTREDGDAREGGGVRVFRIPRGVLGIPADLDDPLVTAVLSADGLARASEDLTMGPQVGADAADLASLVEARLGVEVLDRLVRPVAGGIHAADPSELTVDTVAPGLRAALAEHGSLIAAAAAVRAAAPAVSPVVSVAGSLSRLSDALADRIVAAGGEVRTGRTTVSISPAPSQSLVAALPPADGGAQTRTRVATTSSGHVMTADVALTPVAASESAWSVTHRATDDPSDIETVTTDRLIIAVDPASALRLLGGLPGLDVSLPVPRGADVAIAVLVLDAPELDAAPRGSGVLVAPPADPSRDPEHPHPSAGREQRVACKALTHASAKWPRTDLPPHRHIVRLSYGRAGQPTPEPTPALALADASTLLGVELDASSVVGFAVERFPNALPPHTPDHRARVAALLDAVAQHPGLGVTGAWIAGTGLAATIPHAAAVATHMAVHPDLAHMDDTVADAQRERHEGTSPTVKAGRA